MPTRSSRPAEALLTRINSPSGSGHGRGRCVRSYASRVSNLKLGFAAPRQQSGRVLGDGSMRRQGADPRLKAVVSSNDVTSGQAKLDCPVGSDEAMRPERPSSTPRQTFSVTPTVVDALLVVSSVTSSTPSGNQTVDEILVVREAAKSIPLSPRLATCLTGGQNVAASCSRPISIGAGWLSGHFVSNAALEAATGAHLSGSTAGRSLDG